MEDDLYAHFKLRHCFDDTSTVSKDLVESIGFVTCPKCFKVFKRGRVHPTRKCRQPRHIDAALSGHHIANDQAFREGFWNFNFGSLQFREHLPSVSQTLGYSAPVLDYLPGGEDLHSDFRKIFIVLVGYLKQRNHSEDEYLAAWTMLFALPRMLLCIPLGKEDQANKSTTSVVQKRISAFFACQFTKLYAEYVEVIDAQNLLANAPRHDDPDATLQYKKVFKFLNFLMFGG